VRQRQWAADVPREFQDAKLGNYRVLPGNGQAIALAKRFVAGASNDVDLLPIGSVGSGKTRLAASVLNELFAATKVGWFVRCP
jgi:hypothetical protein